MKDGKTHCDDAHCFLKPPFFCFSFLLLPPPSWVFVIRGYKKSTNTTKKSAAVKVHPRVSQSGHACNFKTCYEKWPHVQLSWWRKFAVEKIFLDLDASSFISAVKLGILTHGLTHFWSQTQGTADFGPFFSVLEVAAWWPQSLLPHSKSWEDFKIRAKTGHKMPGMTWGNTGGGEFCYLKP